MSPCLTISIGVISGKFIVGAVVYEFVVEIKEGVVPSVLEANREVYKKY